MTRALSALTAAAAMLAAAPAFAQTTPETDPPTQPPTVVEDSVEVSAPPPLAQGSAPEEDAPAPVGFAVRTIDDLSQSRVRAVLATTPPDDAPPSDPATPPS